MAAPSAQKPGRADQPKKRAGGVGAGAGRGELARAGGMVVLAGLFIAFALLNLNQVRVDWILGSGHAPLIIVIAISLLVGIVLTYFAERLSRRRRG
ncbi:MAG: hypothetical protein ACLPUT_07640 [Solirubrobacteraceae bacterium]|jgi:uncharacterized integral membrane protein